MTHASSEKVREAEPRTMQPAAGSLRADVSGALSGPIVRETRVILPSRITLDVPGHEDAPSQFALLAYADDQSAPVRSLNVPVFKCSGVAPAILAKRTRTAVMAANTSKAAIVLKKTMRWYALPLSLHDDATTTDDKAPPHEEDSRTQQVLDAYLKETTDFQDRVDADRTRLQADGGFGSWKTEEESETTPQAVAAVEDPVQPSVDNVDDPGKVDAATSRVDAATSRVDAATSKVGAAMGGAAAATGATETDEEKADRIAFDADVERMMTGGRAVNVEDVVDLIRPGTVQKQTEFVLLYVECDAGFAVAVVGAYSDPDLAEAACESVRRRMPYVNACIGPIGAFRPMPPGDFALERAHANGEMDRILERMKKSKPVGV
jgi:hypothetical protein